MAKPAPSKMKKRAAPSDAGAISATAKRVKQESTDNNSSTTTAVQDEEDNHTTTAEQTPTASGNKNTPNKDNKSTEETKDNKSEKKKSGFLYELNLKYNELQNSKKPRNTERLVTDMIKMVEKKSNMPKIQLGTSSDGSRCLQAMLKHGTRNQRTKILDFFVNEIPDLICGPSAGGMLVEKILRYCPKVETGDNSADSTTTNKNASFSKPQPMSLTAKKEQEKIIEKILKPLLDLNENKFSKLFFHKFGCKCFSNLYNCAFLNQKTKNLLLNKVLVPRQISLLQMNKETYNCNAKLSTQVTAMETEVLKQHLVPHLSELVDKCTDKELWDQPITHGILALFLQVLLLVGEKELEQKDDKAGDQEQNQKYAMLRQFIDSERFPIDAVPHLLQTKFGSEALCKMLGFYSAKQKKQVLKLFKGKFKDMAQNNVCYLIVLRLLLTLDDTVLAQKQILAEILTNGGGGEKSSTSTDDVSLASLLQDNNYVKKILYACVLPATTLRFSPYEMEHCISLPAPSSLKDPEKRRLELKKYAAPLLQKTIEQCGGYSNALQHRILADIAGCFLRENEDELCKKLFSEEESQVKSLLMDSSAGLPILLALLKESKVLAEALYAYVEDQGEGFFKEMVLSPRVYLLIEAYKTSQNELLRAAAVALKKPIQNAEKEGKKVKGAKILLEVVEGGQK
ncbi:unnamed protein product [Amoebophrya sp. A120]|nr:unnamed protein product [Amoebophrya sp. A120]|eukprot:GSA120T00000940001.1